jgi:hypothetical protein
MYTLEDVARRFISQHQLTAEQVKAFHTLSGPVWHDVWNLAMTFIRDMPADQLGVIIAAGRGPMDSRAGWTMQEMGEMSHIVHRTGLHLLQCVALNALMAQVSDILTPKEVDVVVSA